MRTLPLAAALTASLAASSLLSGCVAKTYIKLKQEIDSPLGRAAKSQDRGQIFAALAADVEIASVNAQGQELIRAILNSRKAEALRLVESGADINATIINSLWKMFDGYTPLILASWSDDLPLVKALVAKGADVAASAPNGADAASAATSVAMLTFVLDQGYPINKELNERFHTTLLSSFALQGKNEIVRLLLSRGASTEAARASLEATIRFLKADPSIAGQPSIVEAVAKQNTAIALIDRLSSVPAPQTAASAGGVTKEELRQMMKEAAAETARPAAAPASVVYKSDVDAPAYKVSENPDAYALVIGVEKYNTLPEARFAERDAKAMNAHLLAMGYPQRNIVLLTGPQATRTGLVKNLEAWLPNNVTERSTVLFYFSGHGAPDAKSSQAYLVPMDGDPQYLEETAYPIKRLYAKLAALKAKRVLVALDSCFSGAGGRSVLATGTRPLVAKMDLAPAEGKIVSLSASSSDEITGALEDQGHGLFTYQLLKALTETAGRGTVSEVYAALKPRVQDEARRQNRAQTPQAFGASLDGGLR